ncbi:MAG: hypothetical protein ACLVI9_05955 [Anaerostipes hadrus]
MSPAKCTICSNSKWLHTKDQIYSAMVVYGLLTYEDGKVFIPKRVDG